MPCSQSLGIAGAPWCVRSGPEIQLPVATLHAFVVPPPTLNVLGNAEHDSDVSVHLSNKLGRTRSCWAPKYATAVYGPRIVAVASSI